DVSLSGLLISNRDITARGYPMISGVGANRLPLLLIPKEENLIYSPGKSGNYRRSSPIISRRVLISSFSAHFKRGKPGLCPGSSVAALPCKVTFQIEPLRDGLHTIAVRISDSDILGIPAAG
ncbi:hypothetical protein D3Z42_16710, partial [Lachnospiraceae bacterium]|nr:hypothetical protein [Lachnospiraceae bacterium]